MRIRKCARHRARVCSPAVSVLRRRAQEDAQRAAAQRQQALARQQVQAEAAAQRAASVAAARSQAMLAAAQQARLYVLRFGGSRRRLQPQTHRPCWQCSSPPPGCRVWTQSAGCGCALTGHAEGGHGFGSKESCWSLLVGVGVYMLKLCAGCAPSMIGLSLLKHGA